MRHQQASEIKKMLYTVSTKLASCKVYTIRFVHGANGDHRCVRQHVGGSRGIIRTNHGHIQIRGWVGYIVIFYIQFQKLKKV